MKKIIALVFSDLHLNIWRKFNSNNERTLQQFRVLHSMYDLHNIHNVPIIHCGDLFHKPEGIDSELLHIFDISTDQYMRDYNRTCESWLYSISGNHDMNTISKVGIKPWSLVEYVSNHYNFISCIDYKSLYLGNKVWLHGIPYIDNNTGLSEYIKNNLEIVDGCKNILVLHTDYPGAKDTDGRVIGSVDNLNQNAFKDLDLVLCGHIHKPQQLGKKVFMIGAPNQQRRTDKCSKLGYWELYSDLTMKFIELKGFPKFIDVESEADIKDDGNYYTVISKKASETKIVKHKITKQLSKKTLASRYMRAKGIRDKEKKGLLVNILNKSDGLC